LANFFNLEGGFRIWTKKRRQDKTV